VISCNSSDEIAKMNAIRTKIGFFGGLWLGAWMLASSFILQPSSLLAFPPAPHHTFMGQVRDEYGNPIANAGATVIFHAASGRTIKTSVVNGLAPGMNYRLSIPMDAGLTSELYKPTAMRPTLPFTMEVDIDGVKYLPIEVAGT